MKRHLGGRVSGCLVAAILLTAVSLLGSSDGFTIAPPASLYSHYLEGDTLQREPHELAELLRGHEWLNSHYEPGSFDCSEMSAFLELSLELLGWHTLIVCGPTPWNPEKRHAWLLVELSPGTYVPIEATIPRLASPRSPYFDQYFEYDHLFETIYDALRHNPKEFDWWHSL